MSDHAMNVRLTPEERRRMQQIAESLPTKTAKIRALARAGYKRARIADFLNIRYQHVRNVLVGSAREKGSNLAAAATDTEEASGELMSYGRATVDEKGSLALPATALEALEVRAGGWIPWRFEDGELKLMNRSAALRFGQSLAADLAKQHPGVWSDQLIAERRVEADREDVEQTDD